MSYQIKDISHSEFFQQIDQFATQAEELKDREELETQEYRAFADQLINAVIAHIQQHITPDPKMILNLLTISYSRHDDLIYDFYDFEREPDIRRETQRVDRFYYSLIQLISYLKIIDTLIDPNSAPLIESVTDKNDFVLQKLHTLFSGGEYSIETILQLNGISFRHDEPHEIADDLRRRGYLTMKNQWGNNSMAKISIKGANYVERKAKQKKKKQIDTDLTKKLDSVIEHLNKLGAGQEIIFDEIGELKDLQHTLSKKTWSQLLKGKLLDLALDKIISTETASFVYEYLTNGELKALKFP